MAINGLPAKALHLPAAEPAPDRVTSDRGRLAVWPMLPGSQTAHRRRCAVIQASTSLHCCSLTPQAYYSSFLFTPCLYLSLFVRLILPSCLFQQGLSPPWHGLHCCIHLPSIKVLVIHSLPNCGGGGAHNHCHPWITGHSSIFRVHNKDAPAHVRSKVDSTPLQHSFAPHLGGFRV